MSNVLENVNAFINDFSFTPVHITTHDKKHKLAGLESISTSVLKNKICAARRLIKDSICSKCYASNLVKTYGKLEEHLSNNYDILTSHIMSDEEIARVNFNTRFARIESFGDVANVTHCINYINIMKHNKYTNFGIWSKNYAFWFLAFDKVGKPENCTFVVSSPFENKPITLDEIPERWHNYVDHIFTCYAPENYPIVKESHCAGVRCRECLKCYTKGTALYINEATRTNGKKNREAREEIARKLANM